MAADTRSPASELYLLDLAVDAHGSAPVVSLSDRVPEFGVFFDGTGNNLVNALASDVDNDAPTNVAKLSQLYLRDSFTSWHYEEGVGTRTGAADSRLDMGLALSFRGHVANAIRQVRAFCKSFPLAPTVRVDVFGFSRGAAAARAFVNEVHMLSATRPKFWHGPRLLIRFLGLFDSVASIGLPGDDCHGEVNIDLHPEAVDYVYHLTAGHEQREYFPLQSILSGPERPPAPHFVEEARPGAHSDVGGGYGPPPDLVFFPEFYVHWASEPERRERLAEIRSQLLQLCVDPGADPKLEGEVRRADGRVIPIELERRRVAEVPGLWEARVRPVWARQVDNALARVALRDMHARALQRGVPLRPLADLPPEMPHAIPPRLSQLLQRLELGESAAAAELYRHYVHHSHQYGRGPDDVINSNRTEGHPQHAAANGKREVFYNDPANGVRPADRWRDLERGASPEEALLYAGERWIRV